MSRANARREPRLGGRYPYHYWILSILRDYRPEAVLISTIDRLVETKFREQGLWDAERLEAPLPKTRDRTFESEIRQAVHRDLSPKHLVDVHDASVRITDEGLNWLSKHAEPPPWPIRGGKLDEDW